MNNLISLSNLYLYKNQKLKIGILGGSFDPAHFGHLHIALCAIKEIKFDEIWFAISPQNPLKPPHKYPYEERIERIYHLIEDYENIKIITIESELNIIFTADFFEYLIHNLSNIDFYFFMGADLAKKIHEWEKFDKLINIAKLVIFSRAGYTSDVESSVVMKEYSKSGKVRFIPIEEVEISSTEIRNKEEAINDIKQRRT